MTDETNQAGRLRVVHGDNAPLSSMAQGEEPDGFSHYIEVAEAVLSYPLFGHSRKSLKGAAMSILGHRENNPAPKFITALQRVSFRIDAGERVAIIGHNGSGKSSLLRALAGIYALESGSIGVVGRIGTLLDIGLGFELEATGRENIYYRGMTMGYSRQQLRVVEDEIIAFADLGLFIDMPVRTYSTGMFVRLGFAVSTQFTPDILLVDEVFGAGDGNFAQRALARMEAIIERAGIFVMATHDVALIERTCSRVIWLSKGQIVQDGPMAAVLRDYTRFMFSGEAPTAGGETGR